jgi:hypothetical protein
MPSMLTFEQIRDELAAVQWRPGFTFRLYQHRHHGEGIWLSIAGPLPDAYRPGEMVAVNVRTAVPPIPDLAYLHVWLDWRLERFDSHETREFYRVRGEAIFDPHAADANDG